MRIKTTIINLQQENSSKEAFLFDQVTFEHLLETNKLWRPVVVEAAQALHSAGKPPLSYWHWDWTSKESELDLLANTFYGLETDGALQGLMKVDKVLYAGRLPGQVGKPLIYVDYVEVAPWNTKAVMAALGKTPKFGGVGTRLMEAAVRLSMREGFEGRVGLHSLGSSQPFYRNTCGMESHLPDSDKQNLLWFEFTPQSGKKFIGK